MAPNPPNEYGLTLTIAAGKPAKTFFPSGREPTSVAFLRQPGRERLYSGVTKRCAWHERIGENVETRRIDAGRAAEIEFSLPVVQR